MTASLPLPDDLPPDIDGGDDTEAARKAASPSPRPARRPNASARAATGSGTAERKPATPRAGASKKPGAASTEAERAAKPAAKKPAARKPAARKPATKKPAAPRTAPSRDTPTTAEPEGPAVVADAASVPPPIVPGPPPPLPEDLVIPPRPPLPPVPPLPADVDVPVSSEPDPPVAVEAVEPDAAVEQSVAVEPDVPVELESEPAPDPVAFEQSVAVELEPEPAPDPVAAAPDAAVEHDTAAELDAAPAPDPVVAEAEPVGDDLIEPVQETRAVELPLTQADTVVVSTDEAAVEALVAAVPSADADEDVPALMLRGVTKTFGGTVAVDAIDLTVPAGSFYGIVGPNGAGKTTTLSMIAGLLRPDSGAITVNGIDARARGTRAKRAMGVLPDRLRTFDRLTGRQLLYYYGVLRGLSPAVVESRIGDLARAFDLVDALGRSVSDYSAGMTKKVMLAGAMIHSPRLLVLDEPFESLDPVSSAVILDILTTYVSHGGTVILSSHGMELVERVCSRVAVLVAGQVLAEGTIDEVRGEGTLQERFLELAGGTGDVEGLEWLHSFSD